MFWMYYYIMVRNGWIKHPVGSHPIVITFLFNSLQHLHGFYIKTIMLSELESLKWGLQFRDS